MSWEYDDQDDGTNNTRGWPLWLSHCMAFVIVVLLVVWLITMVMAWQELKDNEVKEGHHKMPVIRPLSEADPALARRLDEQQPASLHYHQVLKLPTANGLAVLNAIPMEFRNGRYWGVVGELQRRQDMRAAANG